MAILEDSITKKIESLKKQREELVANVNAISGAIQFAEQLLEEEAKKTSNAAAVQEEKIELPKIG